MFLHKKGTKWQTLYPPNLLMILIRKVLLSSPEYGSGKLFIFKPGGDKPSWEKYIKKIDPTISLLSSLNNSIVMTLYISGYLVSLTFGYGNTKLDTETIVSDFGRKASINLVNTDLMREVSDVTISETTFQSQKHNTGIRNSKTIFSKDPAAFVKGLSGYSKIDWEYPFTIGANFSSVGSSLKIKTNIQLDKNLKSMLIYIIEAYNRPLVTQLSFLNKIQPITDDSLSDGLWDNLFHSLATGRITNFSTVYPNESSVNYALEKIPDKKYDLKSVIPGKLESKFLDEIHNNNLSVQWVSNKIMKPHLIVQDDYNNEYKALLKSSIITELLFKQEHYVLLFGV